MDQRFGPYQVGETIGRGTFAKVKVAVHEATKTKVALKVIPRKVMDEDPKSEIKIKREIKILQILRHPHVMRLYDVVQTRHDIILVLEYVSGGELFDYISRRGRLHENLARLFFQQLIAAVAYCHTYNVAHRDLKPENILLEQNMKSIKIGDFGLSSIMRDGKLFETSCGTPNYAAPEVVSGKLYHGREADVWSCGVVLYTMLAGGLPFDDPYVNVLFRKIQSATYQTPSYVPKAAQDLISRLLVPDPLERATIEQILQHPWVREQFPVYLMTIHTDALYQSTRFARDAMSLIEAQMDAEVVSYVATRFRMSTQRVVTIVSEAEARCAAAQHQQEGGSSDPTAHQTAGRKYLAQQTYSVADDKVKPEPLVIPLAETRLRDEEHDVVVAYNILLDRKLARRAIPEGVSSGGGSNPNGSTTTSVGGQPQRHADPNGSITRGEATAAIPMSSSVTHHRFGAMGGASSVTRGGLLASSHAAVEYGSLREYSLGPQSHMPKAASQHGKVQPGNLQRAPDGTMHFSPIFSHTGAAASPSQGAASTQGGKFIDPYVTGFNAVVKPNLTVRQEGAHTLLGALFHKQEAPVCDNIQASLSGPESGVQPTPVGSQTSNQSRRLLAPVEGSGSILPSDDDQRRGTSSEPSAPSSVTPGGGFAFPQATSSGTCKFGSDFMRNGVAFRGLEAQQVYDILVGALVVTGFMCRPFLPFSCVAIRPSGEKIMCKVFKLEKEEYMIDIRVSLQSGMGALEAATELLEVLLRCAKTNVPPNLYSPAGIRVIGSQLVHH